MKLKFATILGSSAMLVASLCLAGNAWADNINGTVWANAVSYPANSAGFNPLTLGAPTSTFTLTPATNNTYPIDFYSATDDSLSGFLTNGGTNGNTFVGTDQTGTCAPAPNPSACGINNDVIEFTGVAYLTNGATYNFTKDDGMYLYIDNGLFINAGNATSPELVSGMWNGTTGAHNFTIWYDEINGGPAQLSSPDFALTPEPSSLLLLGTGLFALAFLLFRKRAFHTTNDSSATLSV